MKTAVLVILLAVMILSVTSRRVALSNRRVKGKLRLFEREREKEREEVKSNIFRISIVSVPFLLIKYKKKRPYKEEDWVGERGGGGGSSCHWIQYDTIP